MNDSNHGLRGRTLVAVAAFLLLLAGPGQALTTVFGPGGTVGAAVPDSAVLGGLDAFTTFGGPNGSREPLGGTANVGQTLFFANGGFYVGFNSGANPPSDASGLPAAIGNNRGYGVIGTGRSDIVFAAGSTTQLLLQVRGTSSGGSTGGNPNVNPELGPGAAFSDAMATVLIYTELGLELTATVSNTGFETLSIDVAALGGESIRRLSLINQGDASSAIVLGELTAIPEPGTALLTGLGLAGLSRAGRRRRRA